MSKGTLEGVDLDLVTVSITHCLTARSLITYLAEIPHLILSIRVRFQFLHNLFLGRRECDNRAALDLHRITLFGDIFQ